MTQARLHSVSDTMPLTRLSSGDTALGGAGTPTPPTGDGNRPGPQKQRAERSLPTDRLSLDKQAEALRYVAQLSGNSRRPVTAEDLSTALGLKGNTGGLSNKFFRDSGWVQSVGRGAYAATDVTLEYERHLAVDPDDIRGARRLLADAAKASWYWQEVGGMLGNGVRQALILHTLMKAAGAASSHMPQLNLLIDWLVWLGLAARDGELLRVGEMSDASTVSESEAVRESGFDELAESPSAVQEGNTESDVADVAAEPLAERRAAAPHNDNALLTFNLSLRITADDVEKLEGDRLQQLLSFAERMRG